MLDIGFEQDVVFRYDREFMATFDYQAECREMASVAAILARQHHASMTVPECLFVEARARRTGRQGAAIKCRQALQLKAGVGSAVPGFVPTVAGAIQVYHERR